MREDAKRRGLPLSGYLFGEINDLYNSLNFAQQQKYFSSRYVDLDSLANSLSADYGFDFEGSADFLSAFAENVYGQGETRTRFSVTEKEKQAAINHAIKEHGITSSYKNAGYILPDGKLLDFSYDQAIAWLT